VADLAKKTKSQVYEVWREKQFERHRKRQSDPHWQEIFKKLISNRAAYSKTKIQLKDIRSRIPDGIPIPVSDPRIQEFKKVKAQLEVLRREKVALKRELIETHGPVDRDLENLSDEELAILSDFEPDLESETDVSPFHDILVVEPVPWTWKDCFLNVKADFNKMSFWNKVNWKAYLNDQGLVRFMIKTDNSREVIRERLAAHLDILKDSGVVTSKRSGKPLVRVVGSLYPQEDRGAIVELNPSAPKSKILDEVIKALPGPFTRKDSLDPERMRALKLRREGNTFEETASELWPKEFKKERKKIQKRKNIEGEERDIYEKYVAKLVNDGKSFGEAYDEADRKFRLKGKTPTNPLKVKAYRLSKK
jgi:hypothetical protein